MTIPAPITVDEFAPRLNSATVIDVRTPGEYASGHIPGAYNIPLDRLDEALPALRALAAKDALVVVCASGARSGAAGRRLAGEGIMAASLDGGTDAWAAGGRELDRPAGAVRTVWPMERQVRLAAGSLVLLGLLLDLVIPGAWILSFLIGGGLVFSAISNTCGMAMVLGKLPYNRGGRASGTGSTGGSATDGSGTGDSGVGGSGVGGSGTDGSAHSGLDATLVRLTERAAAD